MFTIILKIQDQSREISQYVQKTVFGILEKEC